MNRKTVVIDKYQHASKNFDYTLKQYQLTIQVCAKVAVQLLLSVQYALTF